MALGILEPAYADSNTAEHVPGTVDVYAQAQRGEELLSSHPNLKKSEDGTKILIPQPSNDPNDPLVRSRPLSAFLLCLTYTELVIVET